MGAGSSPNCSAFDPAPYNVTREAEEDELSAWAPATYVGEQEALGSGLQIGVALVTEDT